MKKRTSAFAPAPAFALAAAMLLPGAGAGDALHVSAYYYPWYGQDGRHWDEGYPGRGTAAAPALGEYSSRAEATIRQHLDWSRSYGIDNWICSWWGPGSWEDETLIHHVLPALAEAESGTTFAVLYEAEGLLGLDPERGIEFDEEKTEAFVSHFRHLAEHYFSHPACQRIDGRPVVHLYLARAFSGEWERALARVRAVVEIRGAALYLVGDEVYWGDPDPGRLARYDAVTAYNMHGPPTYAGAKDWSDFLRDCGIVYRRHREAAAAKGVAFLPGVMPGFDSGGRHYTIPRAIRPGAGPDSTLEAFLQLAADTLDPQFPALAVTSFNEWHEGTQLEPSQAGDNGGEALARFKRALASERGPEAPDAAASR